MIEIQLHNVVSAISGVTNIHEAEIDMALSYPVDGAFFSPAYRSGRWDGRKHLYKLATMKMPFGKFPTGLVSRVLDIIDKSFPGTEVKVTDLRDRPHQEIPLLWEGHKLFDYEQEAINIAVERTRGIFRLPTGAGKSVVEAGVIARLNVPTLVMSHRMEILLHLKEIAEKSFGFEIGMLGGGTKDLKKFNVAMIQTVQSCIKRAATNKEANRINKFIQEECQCLIVDEAHHVASDTYLLLSNRAFNAYYRYGFSATPFSGSAGDMLIEAGFGKLQMSMTPSDLVRRQRLSKPYIFFVDYGDETSNEEEVKKCHACGCDRLQEVEKPIGKKGRRFSVEDGAADDLDLSRTVYKCVACAKEWTIYQDAMTRAIVKNEKRNDAICQLAAERIRKGKSVLIVVTYIAHGEELEKKLKLLVDPQQVQFVQGATQGKKHLLEQLAQKQKMCLIATNVFGEGVDIPSLDCLINAKASASTIDIVQVTGRALRRAPGKWKAIIIDFQDKSDYFKKRTKFRMKLLSEEPEYVVRKIKLPERLSIIR